MYNNYGQYGGQMPDVQPTPPPYYHPTDYVFPEEKKKIRKNYNSIGITLLCYYIIGLIVFYVTFFIILETGYETAYDDDGTMIAGLVEVTLGTWIFALTGMAVFAGHCIFTRYNPKEIFRTERIKAGEVVKYILIALCFQRVSMICTIFITLFLDSVGLEVTAFDYSVSHDPYTYASSFISSVILAPIGEELIFRGVVLRSSAKVSGRFAIFFSAFMFGLMHGNPYQFVLGFLLGIPLAMITLKTGSIIPAIICHMANNLSVEIISIVGYFDEPMANILNLLSIPVFIVIGIIILANMIPKGEIQLPPYTERHRKRTFPIMITSWSMILITIFYIIDTIGSLGFVDYSAEEAITEAMHILVK